MITPKKKLRDFISNFGSLEKFSEYTKIDKAILSKLLSGKRGATTSNVEIIDKLTGLKFEEAWEIVEDN